MLSPISIYSSSTDDIEEPLAPLNPEDFDFDEEEEDHRPHDFGEGNRRESFTDRLPKKPRVRVPDGTALDEASFGLLESLGSNFPQNLRDVNMTAPAAGNSDTLLIQLLEIFPDISHTYVKDLIDRHQATLRLQADLQANGVELAVSRDAIYEEILGLKSYPKQEENPKRKREDSSEDADRWEDNTAYQSNAILYTQAAADILAREFPFIPVQHFRKVLSEKKRLYHTFLTLFADDNLLGQSERSFTRLKKCRVISNHRYISSLDSSLTRELNAAKKEAATLEASVRKKRQKEEAEKANEEECTRTGNTIECQCCYDEAPANRCVPCEGTNLHFFCFTCIRKSAETQIGLMKYEIKCFDFSGCQAIFARPHLKEVLGSSLMEKLDSLQQDDEVRKAGLDGLEDCPFCDFKAVLPPVEEDREFRCENPSCQVASCRLCKEKSHIPLTCEESKKDKGLTERHEVEEAMSKALIRNCPKCSVKIVKEFGCNKLQCPQCRTLMCYICQKDITKDGYGHFGRACAQDDAMMQEREEREVREAEKAAIEKILAENPGMTEEELRVKHPRTGNTPLVQPRYHGDPQIQLYNMARPQAQLIREQRLADMGRRLGNNQYLGRYVPPFPYNPQPPASLPNPRVNYNNLDNMMNQVPNRATREPGIAQRGARIVEPIPPPAPREIRVEARPNLYGDTAAQIYTGWNDQGNPVHMNDWNPMYMFPNNEVQRTPRHNSQTFNHNFREMGLPDREGGELR
ncbi:hypothetical protein BDW59DRAFT_38650 [Aspergillus cavernicola]|uniref:RING-type domain-containing protein n=1 Tax=Aspergillus cavernicola TaxID=176166 RepID=A0ABR4INF4_9EURO